jgi:deoxyhypusine synthase
MTAKYPAIDFGKINTYSLKSRKSKVKKNEFAMPYKKGAGLRYLLNSLPNILSAKNFKEVVDAIILGKKKGKTVTLAMGAHPIKVGLNPIIIDLMKRGIITHIAMNGACIVHDFELAYVGQTSEDVDHELVTGSFGMAEETGRMLNEAIKNGVKKGFGIGRAVGDLLIKKDFRYNNNSILAAGVRYNIPVTVHVAIGTDIIHMHPSADGAAIGEGSMRDFKTFVSMVSGLEKGVYINLGSAVLMPEIFLKAVSVVRNLGYRLKDFTTVNMDFIQHYRPNTNVVKRPTIGGGRGYALTGHHEIMLPLLAAAVIEGL